MLKKSPSINLLKRQTSITERFISWALSIGRLVVILTEIVALGAFIYRFSLDRQLIDLRSKITQEQAIVNYLKDNEATYRNLQERLAMASTYSNSGQTRLNIYKDISGFAPRGMALTNLSLFEDRIRMEANVDSVSSLNSFVASLKKYPAIDTISVDKIESKPSNSVITVTITTTLKPNLTYANTK